MLLDDVLRGFSARLFMVAFTILGLTGILVIRLYSVQIKGGKKHHEQISKQSIRRIRLPPTRGRIISGDGQLLADNVPRYNVYFHIHELRKGGLSRTLKYVQEQIDKASWAVGRPSRLEPIWDGKTLVSERVYFADQVSRKAGKMKLGKRTRKKIDDLLEKGTTTNLKHWLMRQEMMHHIRLFPALPVQVFSDLTLEELSRLEEVMPGIPGMEISTGYQRIYTLGPVGAHFIGYTGRRYPSREQAREAYYFYPERAGKTGLEAKFDHRLSGEVGRRIVRVDSFGMYHDDEQEPIPSVPGHDLVLTIDARAQALGLRVLRGRRAALVLVDVNSGAVLALVSSPAYDLRYFRKIYSQLRDDPDLPLLNRAVAGGYAPGSIVKPLMAISILEHQINRHDTQINCVGYYQLGRQKIRCHRRSGHGLVNLVKAIEVSCNPYFIDSGMRLGIDKISQTYQAAGIGQRTGLEIGGVLTSGRLPSRATMQAVQHRSWRSADTALVSIGQGFISLSPLQVAIYTAAIANGGKRYQPYLVSEIRDHRGQVVDRTEPQIVDRLPASSQTLRIVRAAMYKVVHGENASAPIARTPIIKLAGKTGTAEIGSRANRRKNTWFTCFGPYEDPKYALTVLVEDGISGGKTAAPIAREFFDTYLMITGEARRRR